VTLATNLVALILLGWQLETHAGAVEWATMQRDYIAFVDAFWADSHAPYMM
jgi:hypothetical protein